jgi:hypothetical protein
LLLIPIWLFIFISTSFANAQWGYVLKKQSTAWGRFVDKRFPDAWDVPRRARVAVSAFPETSTAEFPPYYHKKIVLLSRRSLLASINSNYVPMITMGRYGVVLKKARPSDDAIIAMFNAAKHVIRLALQDIGSLLLPGTKLAIPGSVWPVDYLNVLAKVIWTKGVDVEIVLSNPNSIPGNINSKEANYGNGWNCVDVAAEIIKAIKAQFPDAHDGDLRQRVQENLRLCFIRCPRGGTTYENGKTIGLHCKSSSEGLCFASSWFLVFPSNWRSPFFIQQPNTLLFTTFAVILVPRTCICVTWRNGAW